MDEAQLRTLLHERGAMLRGHFRLASGRHSDTYIEKFRILQWPGLAEQMCATIADAFRGQPTIVAGPTTGGIILSYEVARQLGLAGVFAESADGGGREFRRGFSLGPGDRVLVVDDILTTGGSIRDVLDAVRASGATPIGVGVMVDRSGGPVDFGIPLRACLTVTVETYQPEDCPMCATGEPLVVT